MLELLVLISALENTHNPRNSNSPLPTPQQTKKYITMNISNKNINNYSIKTQKNNLYKIIWRIMADFFKRKLNACPELLFIREMI